MATAWYGEQIWSFLGKLALNYLIRLKSSVQPDHMTRDALLLKQMVKKQTGFVLLLKQNKSDLVILHRNQNKSNMF